MVKNFAFLLLRCSRSFGFLLELATIVFCVPLFLQFAHEGECTKCFDQNHHWVSLCFPLNDPGLVPLTRVYYDPSFKCAISKYNLADIFKVLGVLEGIDISFFLQ